MKKSIILIVCILYLPIEARHLFRKKKGSPPPAKTEQNEAWSYKGPYKNGSNNEKIGRHRRVSEEVLQLRTLVRDVQRQVEFIGLYSKEKLICNAAETIQGLLDKIQFKLQEIGSPSLNQQTIKRLYEIFASRHMNNLSNKDFNDIDIKINTIATALSE